MAVLRRVGGYRDTYHRVVPPPSPQPTRSGQGLWLGQPFGVPIHLAWSWFIGSAVIVWLFTPLVESRLPELGGWSVVVAGCFAVLLGVSVLIHELAHAVTALHFGQSVRRITLHLLGGVSEIEGELNRPWVDFTIAAVGPAASLVLAGAGFGLTKLLPDETVVDLVAWQLAVANLLVGIFNLVPGLPLDGGRMLRDVVWALTGREQAGTVVAAWTGRVVAVALVALALLPLFMGSDDIVWLVWGLLLATFVWSGAGRALASSRMRSALPGVSARTLARRALPVEQSLPVSEGLRLLAGAQAGAIVTVDHDGTPVGVVHEAAVAAIPAARRPWVELAAVARTLGVQARVPADLAGEELLARLGEGSEPEYVVVNTDGTIHGVLSRDDVEQTLAQLAHGQ